MPCAVCHREVPPGQGFANAHGVVCSFKCAGEFNRKAQRQLRLGAAPMNVRDLVVDDSLWRPDFRFHAPKRRDGLPAFVERHAEARAAPWMPALAENLPELMPAECVATPPHQVAVFQLPARPSVDGWAFEERGFVTHGRPSAPGLADWIHGEDGHDVAHAHAAAD